MARTDAGVTVYAMHYNDRDDCTGTGGPGCLGTWEIRAAGAMPSTPESRRRPGPRAAIHEREPRSTIETMVSHARGIALVTAAIAIGVSGWSGSARADETCPPAVIVTGDRGLARELAADLERRGVGATARDGCPRVTAEVARQGELVQVEATDEYGRSRTWEVRDVATAGALVESWTKQEADEIVLGPAPEKAAPEVIAMVPPEREAATVVDTVVPAPTGAPGMRGGVSVAVESATAGGAAWYGGTVGGCVRLAIVCVGGRLRGGRSTPPHHGLTALDLLATVELPIGRAGFVVAPGATLGVGWTRATTDDPHALDPSMDVGGVRAGVQLAVARRIAGAFSVELLLGFDGAILGQSDAPAALPRSLGRIGLGLRYGGR